MKTQKKLKRDKKYSEVAKEELVYTQRAKKPESGCRLTITDENKFIPHLVVGLKNGDVLIGDGFWEFNAKEGWFSFHNSNELKEYRFSDVEYLEKYDRVGTGTPGHPLMGYENCLERARNHGWDGR